MPLFVGKLLKATRSWPGEAAGLYTLLLMHQWQEGSIPDDLDDVARLLSVQPAALRKHWDRISAKFERREVDGGFVLVNPFGENVYSTQLAAYLARVERNRTNGAKGGRPKKPNQNPLGSESDTGSVATSKPSETRKEKREKRTPSTKEDTVGKPTEGDAAPPGLDFDGLGGVVDLTKPFGKCYATLYLLHANLGQAPPPWDDAKKHLRGTTKLLPMAQQLGPDVAADLIAWVYEHIGGGRSIPNIYENRAGYLRQMSQGVEWVPRRHSSVAAVAKPGLVDALGRNPFE